MPHVVQATNPPNLPSHLRDAPSARLPRLTPRPPHRLWAWPSRRLWDGPPDAVAIIQRGDQSRVYTAGAADLATGVPPAIDDQMRLASVSKAFSGAEVATWQSSISSPMRGSIEATHRLRFPLLGRLEPEAGDRAQQGPSGARDADQPPELRRSPLYIRLAVHDEADGGECSSRRTPEGDRGEYQGLRNHGGSRASHR